MLFARTSNFQSIFRFGTVLTKRQPVITKTRVAIGSAILFSFIGYRQGKNRYNEMHFAQMYDTIPDTKILTQEYFGEPKVIKRNFLQRFLLFLRRTARAFHLALKFFPLMLFLPIAYIFKRHLYPYWLEFMLYTLQSAGPLWIKLGQWASHRGDIFGEEITRSLEQLRDSADQHPMKKTHEQFEQEFGKKIYDVFEFFNEQPVASGSIAQIYKARLNGQNVAIKVRHPDIIQNLEMDIKILYTVSNFLGRTILKQLAMPVTFEEFQSALVSQTDLRFEAKSLEIFNQKFSKQSKILFPKPIEPYISSSVLTETFEEGISLTKFLDNKPSPLHSTIANLGIKAFYKMLIYDNFIHADCHAGNIMVRLTPNPKPEDLNDYDKFFLWLEKIEDNIFEKVEKIVEYSLTKMAEYQINKNKTSSKNEEFKVLSMEQKTDEKNYTEYLHSQQENNKNVQLIFLDPGMVTILNKNDRIAFLQLVMYITLRKPKECGYLMLQLSQYHESKVKVSNEVKRKFLGDMEDLFESICAVPLAQMNIGLVLRSMLEILRNNGMSIEGHFAALLTNMIVLEGIGKQLDPEINIVAKAAAFLLHLRTIDKTIDEIIQQTL